MGEAEDAMARRRQQASVTSDEEMQEFYVIKESIESLIPLAIENLRKHDIRITA